MARCILGLGNARSLDFPFRRAHIGRAFVDHVADVACSGRWRPVSGAYADLCEHSSGIVLCRLWPAGGSGAGSSEAEAAVALQCIRYLGIRAPGHVAVAHAEIRRPAGQFGASEGDAKVPMWSRGVVEALARSGAAATASDSSSGSRSKTAPSDILRLHFGVGAPGPRGPDPLTYGELPLSAREATAVLQSAFPAAFEWVLKRWLGPRAVTEGQVFRRRLPQDTRRGALKAMDEQ